MINQAFSRPFFNAFYLNITFLFWTRQLKSLCVFFAIKLKVQKADFSCSQTLLIFSGNLTYEDTANSITYNLVPFVFLIIAFFLFRICKYILSDIFANHLKMFHLNFHAINKIDLKYFNFRAQKHPYLDYSAFFGTKIQIVHCCNMRLFWVIFVHFNYFI